MEAFFLCFSLFVILFRYVAFCFAFSGIFCFSILSYKHEISREEKNSRNAPSRGRGALRRWRTGTAPRARRRLSGKCPQSQLHYAKQGIQASRELVEIDFCILLDFVLGLCACAAPRANEGHSLFTLFWQILSSTQVMISFCTPSKVHKSSLVK